MNTYLTNKIPGAFIILFLGTLFTGLLFPSCEEDDTPSASNAIPEVRYVRITNPEKSDSLLTHAFMGNTVALIGENLGDVVELWFNDQPAILAT